jgi:hypothetical protein
MIYQFAFLIETNIINYNNLIIILRETLHFQAKKVGPEPAKK